MFIYYVGLEASFGWTIGKLATGTRVINKKGRKPTVGDVIGRTLMRFVPFEPLTVLFGRGWHDSASDTRVVRVRR